MSDDRYQLINDQEEGTRILLEGWQVGMWTAIPGIVQSVDMSALTCEVQPAIQALVVDQTGKQSPVDLPLLVDVPIVFPKGGGFLITMPLSEGDEVLVCFSSRCIDAWWQSGGIQQAMEARMHDLSDGFAIPGPFSQPEVPSDVSETELQIRNSENTARVSIDETGKVSIISATEIDITAPAVVVTGALTVNGALVSSSIGTTGGGGATIAGALTAATVSAGGKDLATHIHSGVTVGAGNTGPPV